MLGSNKNAESKRIQIECLIDQLLNLRKEKEVAISPTICEELVGEAGRVRGTFQSHLLTRELKQAAKELRQHEDIIIRKGDKSSVYVIMDKDTYFNKLDGILGIPYKFQQHQKDPSENIKKRINHLKQKVNSTTKIFNQAIGDFSPGYCYGTVKTHKQEWVSALSSGINMATLEKSGASRTKNLIKKRLQEAQDRFQSATDEREQLWTTFATGQDHIRYTAGLNCHYIRHPHPESKRIQIECLIDQLLNLRKEKKVAISPTICEELVGEAGRVRGTFQSHLLTRELKQAAKELRQHEDIIILKGDKSSVYVIMDKDTYFNKLDGILGIPYKFQQHQKDPSENIKKRINHLKQKVNSTTKIFNQAIGDFSPGYCYGTVKTHKQGNPLRPIGCLYEWEG
ncbi:hypothetical protein Pmani_006451 [Petrolisthes manimaculis]|uniref:Uncharacterized protein n=1 Tax=Petrolisthes manimaculis TaxID=1843537 RepID=A0AAE1QBM0_9EUCA|nr:hypothetical protein Pmani_006451 [Petrolisthes manimaculis]